MQGLELILILLAVAAALRVVAERFNIPLPVLLVLGGLLLAVAPGLPRLEIEPDVVFLIFIPPLLYWAALTTSLRDFRRNLRSISLLAVGLVLATMTVVAWTAHSLIPEMSWAAAFVLGAVVSPPDAVAVTAVTRRLGLPKSIEIVLEGESLVNDATAFVAYRMAVAAVVAGTFSIWQAGFRFLWTALGAVALGLVIGWLIDRLRRFVGKSPVVENTISLLTPFAAFIPAEQLGLASVLTVVATGLYLGRRGPKIVSAETRLQAAAMWEMLVFVLEGLIFILIGLELPNVLRALAGHTFSLLIGYTIALSAAMILVRVVWVFAGAYLPRYVDRLVARGKGKIEPYPSWREVLFVGWAGMRGGDSLVIALALPLATITGEAFPARDLIIFLTFTIILVTLVVQGLSLAKVIKLLKLQKPNEAVAEAEEAAARLKLSKTGLTHLNRAAEQTSLPKTLVGKLRENYRHRIHRFEPDGSMREAENDDRYEEIYRQLRLEMIAAERAEVINLRDRSEISDDVMRRIQQDLDFEEVLLSSD